jgi:hypothetical protein
LWSTRLFEQIEREGFQTQPLIHVSHLEARGLIESFL